MECFDKESQELISLMISRSVGAGIGDTMVLKVWPDLYFIPGYMRCSLMTPKINTHFSKLDSIIVQEKSDGSFLYLEQNTPEGTQKAFTRSGSHYPTWLVEQLLTGASEGSYVIAGELLVYLNEELLDRQTGNGVLNSVLHDTDAGADMKYTFKVKAWDLLPIVDFKAGLCKIPYAGRLSDLNYLAITTKNISVIKTTAVSSLAEAYKIYSKYTAEGKEGVVIKDPASVWRDHTSPFNIKLKVEFEADYLITGIYEGTGKAKGMLGGVSLATSDGLLTSNCGTGYSDDMRKYLWANDPTGKICTVKANDVISNRDNGMKSLFLPVFVEIREDKKEADSLTRVTDQLEAAKNGGVL